jgi:hypothetical protein
MGGKIEIHRNANDRGKNSSMSITITDVIGKTIEGNVANDCTEVFDVEDGKYNVFVKLGIKSPVKLVTVCSNTVILDAGVTPDAELKEDTVFLRVRVDQNQKYLQGENRNAGKDFNLEDDDSILQFKSPINLVGGPYSIVYKNVEERIVIVAMEFDGQPCLGIHLFKDETGWPSSRGIPVWCAVLQDDLSKLLQYFEFEPGISESLYGFLNGKVKGQDLDWQLYLHLKKKDEQRIKQLLDSLMGELDEGASEQADSVDERIKDIEHNAKNRNEF